MRRMASVEPLRVTPTPARHPIERRAARVLPGPRVTRLRSLLVARFGHPVAPRLVAIYLAGAWAMAGASMLVWQLASIPLAALVFHAGESALLLAAWRGDGGARRSHEAQACRSTSAAS
jgi:hypothetical protein